MVLVVALHNLPEAMRPSKKIAEANQVKLPEPEKKKALRPNPRKVTFTAFFSQSGFSTLLRFPSIFETAVHCRLRQSHI